MKVLELIRQYFSKEKQHDAIPDPRPVFEQELDYKYGEDVLFSPARPTSRRIVNLPIEAKNQGQAGACGAYTASHARDMTEGEYADPLVWYRARSNYPRPGMFVHEVVKMAAKATGMSFYPEHPPRITEQYANSMPFNSIYNNNRGGEFEYIRIKPFDTQAVIEAVTAGHGTMISFYSTFNEWDFEMEVKDFTNRYVAPVRHFVMALPGSFHRKDGKEWVSVIDSAPNRGHFLRHISIDFLKERMFLGGGFYYPIKAEKKDKKVKIELPLQRCQYGQRNADVLRLQKYLVSRGRMQTRHTTGYYGNITAAAVLQWQLENLPETNILNLHAWGGRYWGPASISAVSNRK